MAKSLAIARANGSALFAIGSLLVTQAIAALLVRRQTIIL